jgi:putative nucleotidyltransferase with HDIG domain
LSHREKIIEQIKAVQNLPAATTQIIRAIQDPDIDLAKLTRLIEIDPGLTTNLLKMANSAYFGMPREVTSVREATVRLGTHRIFQLVIASSVAPMVNRPVKGYDLPPGDLWTHSIAVAIGAEKMGKALGIRLPDHTFTSALLHDIGKVVLGTFVEVDVKPILDLAYNNKISFDIAEQMVLGIDHAEVGALLLEYWKLPGSIVDIARNHHQPDDFGQENVVLEMVHIANNLCMISGIGPGMDGLNYKPSRTIVEKYNIKPKITEPVVVEIFTGLKEFKNWFTSDFGG